MMPPHSQPMQMQQQGFPGQPRPTMIMTADGQQIWQQVAPPGVRPMHPQAQMFHGQNQMPPNSMQQQQFIPQQNMGGECKFYS